MTSVGLKDIFFSNKHTYPTKCFPFVFLVHSLKGTASYVLQITFPCAPIVTGQTQREFPRKYMYLVVTYVRVATFAQASFIFLIYTESINNVSQKQLLPSSLPSFLLSLSSFLLFLFSFFFFSFFPLFTLLFYYFINIKKEMQFGFTITV